MKKVINSVMAAALSIGLAVGQTSVTQPGLNTITPNSSINGSSSVNSYPGTNSGTINPSLNGNYNTGAINNTTSGTTLPGSDIPAGSTNTLGTGSYQSPSNTGINSNTNPSNPGFANPGTSTNGGFGTGISTGSAGGKSNGF